MDKYDIIIGMELHVQPSTERKMFCNCPNQYGAAPNTLMCPTCLGLPGALPVINREAVDKAVAAALALNCKIVPVSHFERKNYFYPDLPKDYQITQYHNPYGVNGFVEIEVNGEHKCVRINNVHIEEDTGKLFHADNGSSLVDLNRAGVPLLEIVSEADMTSPDEAYEYCNVIKNILKYAGVSDCDMEKGQLRAEGNISIMPKGTKKWGTKTEIKNINSFKNIRSALEVEALRQQKIIESGSKVVQETLLFDPVRNITAPMRSKEFANDYRYFPEPDLNPLEITTDWIDRIRKALPEMPLQRRARYVREFGIPEYDAGVLVADKDVADFFEKCLTLHSAPGGRDLAMGGKDAKQISNWVMGELLREMKDTKRAITEIPITPDALVALLGYVNAATITNNMAKEVFAEMAKDGKSAKEIIEKRGLVQISDTGELEAVARKAIADNPKAVADYKAGKPTAVQFLVGQIMRATKGKANAKVAADVLLKILSQ
jgi:aspartyl-tRNA(Asn)/glutamyl-tRNA(Gln) amidotransferase subunit B